MRSPRFTCSDASSKSTRAPKALVIPVMVNMRKRGSYTNKRKKKRRPGCPGRPSLKPRNRLVPAAGELAFAATAAAEVATGAVFTGLGFVDGQRAAIEFLAT